MKANFKTIKYGLFFLSIFLVKMAISTAPVFLSIDKRVVNAVILQLELENNAKENPSENKDNNNLFKKGIDFIHYNDFEIAHILTIDDIDCHFVSKQYIKTFFPTVLTPPPNLT